MVSKIGWIQLFRNSGADVPPGIAQRVVAVRTGDASIRSPVVQVAEDKPPGGRTKAIASCIP